MNIKEIARKLSADEAAIASALESRGLEASDVTDAMLAPLGGEIHSGAIAATGAKVGGAIAQKAGRKSAKVGRDVLAARTRQEVAPVPTRASIDYETVGNQALEIGFEAGMNVTAIAAEGYQEGFEQAIVEGAAFTADFREGLHRQGVAAILGVLNA